MSKPVFPPASGASAVRPSRSRAARPDDLQHIPWLVGLDDEERRRHADLEPLLLRIEPLLRERPPGAAGVDAARVHVDLTISQSPRLARRHIDRFADHLPFTSR